MAINHFYADKVTQVTRGQQRHLACYSYDPRLIVGRGMSSLVFKGRCQTTGQAVALKQIDLSSLRNEVQRLLLNNQVRTIRKLNHPNVIKCFGVFQTQQFLYIVTQYCEGGELAEIISSQGALSAVQALRVLNDILQGYSYLEAAGILHRDLKSSNILMSAGSAKIIDFGFSDHSSYERSSITYNVGSPAYMAPQAYISNQYSSKSDIWSIGIILLQMLTGKTLNETASYELMIKTIESGDYGHSIKGKGRYLLSRMLCTKREERIGCKQLMVSLKQQQIDDLRNSTNSQSLNRSFYISDQFQNNSNFSKSFFNDSQGHALQMMTRPKSVNAKEIIKISDHKFKKTQFKERLRPSEKNAFKTQFERSVFSAGRENTCLLLDQVDSSIKSDVQLLKFQFALVRLMFNVLRTASQLEVRRSWRKSQFQYFMIRHMNNLMKKLRQCLSERNVFNFNNWKQLIADIRFRQMKQVYEDLHYKIKTFANKRLEGIPGFQPVYLLFEGHDTWMIDPSARYFQGCVKGFIKELDQELDNLDAHSLETQRRAELLDYTILYYQVAKQLSRGNRELEVKFKLQQVNGQSAQRVSEVHLRLLKLKSKLIFNE